MFQTNNYYACLKYTFLKQMYTSILFFIEKNYFVKSVFSILTNALTRGKFMQIYKNYFSKNALKKKKEKSEVIYLRNESFNNYPFCTSHAQCSLTLLSEIHDNIA